MEFTRAVLPGLIWIAAAMLVMLARALMRRSGVPHSRARLLLGGMWVVGLIAVIAAVPGPARDTLVGSARAFVRPVLVAVIFVALLMGVRRPLERWSRRRYQYNLLFAGLGFAGLIAVILAIPPPAEGGTDIRPDLLTFTGIILGAAVTLASTTLVANAMAGFMLRVIRGFNFGDYLRVGEYFGKVSERGIFHIEIQTESSDLVTLPNVYLVQNPVTVIGSPDPDGRGSCTWVSADVSLGYDVDRTRVAELLKAAADNAELESPWVRIMELGDFSVTYRVTAKLPDVKGPSAANSKRILTEPAQLRAEMMDALHEGDVEIVSPTFMNTRAYPQGTRFMSKTTRPMAAAAPSDADEVDPDVFAKADKVEQIELEREELTSEIEAVKERVKEAEDDGHAKQEAEQTLGELETKAKELDEKLEDPDSVVDPDSDLED
jgi:small-conductance mechanosensitive channel